MRAVYAPAERADTLPLYRLYPYMYSVGTIADLLATFPQLSNGLGNHCLQEWIHSDLIHWQTRKFALNFL